MRPVATEHGRSASDELEAADDAADAAPPLNRMAIAGLALGGLLIAAYMLLYTIGVIGQVACGTGGCETVQASPFATFIGVPVPLIGVLGYGATLAAALLGVQPGWTADRRIALALVGLGAVAFVFTAYLNYLEAFVIRAWCRWCIGSAIVATLIFLFSLREIPRLRRTA